MAKIALIAGIAAAAALTGGLAAAGFGIFAGTFAGGSILGGIALGGSIGLTAGEAIGGFLFQPHLDGPRLSDQQVSGSTEGSPIPFGYGGFRIGGQIVWSSGITETATNQSSGGKGLPGPTTTVYTYTISFAAGFCEGPGAITRIWGDSRLIYDTTSKGAVSSNTLDTGLTHQSGAAITETIVPVVYPGNETQLPDPTIQAAVGINACSAMRGLLYLVYSDFPLSDFGNRLPNIRAEISTNTALSYVKDVYPPNTIPAPDSNVYPWGFSYVDPKNRVAILIDTIGATAARIDLATDDTAPVQRWQASTIYQLGDQVLDSSGNIQTCIQVSGDQKSSTIEPTWTVGGVGEHTTDNHLHWSNTGAGPEAITLVAKASLAPFVHPGSETNANVGATGLPLAGGIDTRGFLWLCYELTIASVTHFYASQFDSTTFALVNRVVLPGPVLAFNFANILGEDLVYATLDPGFSTPALYVIKSKGCTVKTNASYVPSTNSASVYGPLSPIVDPATGIVYVITTPDVNGDTTPWEWNVTVIDPRTNPPATSAHQFFGDSTTHAGRNGFFDSIDQSLVITTKTGCLLKLPLSSWTVSVTTGVLLQTGGDDAQIIPASFNCLVPSQGILYLPTAPSGVSSIGYINHATLVDENDVPQQSWFAESWTEYATSAYDDVTQSIVVVASGSGPYLGFPARIYLNRQEVASETLDQIVLDICERAGLDSSLVDVTALASTNCLGYCVTRNSDAKSAIAPLLMAYFFGAVESDFVLKFVPRGGSVAMTIPEADLGLESEGNELESTIAQEHDLPKTIDVLYADPSLDYQTGKQSRQRNARVVKTKNRTVLELPLTMDGDTAAQIADKALRIIWDERNQYGFKLVGSKYLVLDATDIIAFGYRGNSYVARISKATIGQDRVLEIAAMSEDSHNYLSVQQGQLSPGFPPQIINPAAGSILFFMDMPYFEDTDSAPEGQSGYYFAMSSSSEGWPGAVLQQSPDGSVYEQVGFSTAPIAYAAVAAALPAPATLGGAEVIDRVNTITFRLPAGATIASTTLTNFLNGANAIVLGGELLNFQNATLNPDGSYTVDTLGRGRRGTEYACGAHVTGEYALILPNGLHRNLVPVAQVGLTQYFRVVTIGQIPSAAGVQAETLQGNDLKPYSPCSITGARDGSNNLTIDWIRRTRLGGDQDWLDGVTSVPLSEDSEAYSVDVVVAGAVVRTIAGLTSPTASYPAAEQTADGITPGAPVSIVVYQISAQVGRGFPGAATI